MEICVCNVLPFADGDWNFYWYVSSVTIVALSLPSLPNTRCSVYTVRSMFSLDSGIRLADDQLSVVCLVRELWWVCMGYGNRMILAGVV